MPSDTHTLGGRRRGDFQHGTADFHLDDGLLEQVLVFLADEWRDQGGGGEGFVEVLRGVAHRLGMGDAGLDEERGEDRERFSS